MYKRGMSLMQKDWFLRQLHLLEEALRRIAEKRLKGESAEALEELTHVARDLLGSDLDLVETMDIESAADMLGEPARIELYVRYLFELSELRESMGQYEDAAWDRARAFDLLDHRRTLGGAMQPQTLDLFERLGSTR